MHIETDETLNPFRTGGRISPAGEVASRLLIAGVISAEALILIILGFHDAPAGLAVLSGLAFIILALASPKAAWLAVVALVPFSIGTAIPGTGSGLQMPTEPMILFSEVVWVLGLFQAFAHRWPPRAFLVALIGVLAVPYISCVYSGHPAATFKASTNLLVYVLFGVFLACTSLNNVRDLKRFAAVFALPAALVCIYYLQNIARTSLYIQDVNAAARPLFHEHGTFGDYLDFAFPMAILSILWAKGRFARIGFFLAAVLIFLSILFSLTRAAWLGLLGMGGAVALYAFVGTGMGKKWIAFTLIGLLAIAGMFAAMPKSTIIEHAASIVDTKSNVSNLERFNRWAAAIDMFHDHWIGGVGYGMYKYNYRQYRHIRLSTTESGDRMGAHNITLSILAETGIVGGAVNLLLAASLIVLVRRTLKRAARMGRSGRRLRQMTVALAAGLIGHAIHGLFNYYPAWDKVNVPLWTFIGALTVCAHLADGKSDAPEPSRHAS